MMKAIFKSTEGDYLEATIEINGFYFRVMDVFCGDNLKAGDTVDVEIEPGLYSDEEEWDDYFSGNPDKKQEIVHLGGWKYHVLGMVCSINPVIVDAGILKLDAPVDTNDERVIGSFISFIIDRMDAYSR